MADKRNCGLDILKCLACFLVICIHADYSLKRAVEPLARIAVPVFFMITGYFHERVRQSHRGWEQIRRMFRLILGSSALYVGWELILRLLEGASPTEYLLGFFSAQRWIDFLCFNESPFAYPLWYLSALLYVLVILYCVGKRWPVRRLYPLIPLLLAVNLALGNYSVPLLGWAPELRISRNFLFAGLPFFLLGDYFYNREIMPGNRMLVAGIIVFAADTYLENMLLARNHMLFNKDLYISTIPAACCVFLFAAQNAPQLKNKVAAAATFVGRELSLDIYILHLMVMQALERLSRYFGIYDSVYWHAAPLVVFAVSAAIAWAIRRLRSTFAAH